MHRSMRLSAIAMTVLLLGSFGYAQQDSQNRPLGDVAREDKDRRGHIGQKAKASKVYTNDDFPEKSEEQPDPTPPEKPIPPVQPEAVSQGAPQQDTTNHGRNKDSEDPDDFIVIPAGTPVGVALQSSTAKVSRDVYVGWTVAIPAGSEVTMKIIGQNFNYDDLIITFELTAVKIGDITYNMHTYCFPIFSRVASDKFCKLSEPIRVHR